MMPDVHLFFAYLFGILKYVLYAIDASTPSMRQDGHSILRPFGCIASNFLIDDVHRLIIGSINKKSLHMEPR
jgi:hypothetical protein